MSVFTNGNEIIWQMLPVKLKLPGAQNDIDVTIPIRPYSDADRERFLPMKPHGSWTLGKLASNAGPQHFPTGEERRIFLKVYGDELVPVQVPPYFVICEAVKGKSKVMREAVARQVEQMYDDPNLPPQAPPPQQEQEQPQQQEQTQSRPRVRM